MKTSFPRSIFFLVEHGLKIIYMYGPSWNFFGNIIMWEAGSFPRGHLFSQKNNLNDIIIVFEEIIVTV